MATGGSIYIRLTHHSPIVMMTQSIIVMVVLSQNKTPHFLLVRPYKLLSRSQDGTRIESAMLLGSIDTAPK